MIKLFRKLRENLLSEGKIGIYFKYAFGEIVLVVIGILIALQINNANEVSKQKQQVLRYEQNIISELRRDLEMLNQLDSLNLAQLETINNYLSYYKNPNRNVDTLIQKMRDITYKGAIYRSIAFTIDDIISTGNLSLFSLEKKTALLELKAVQEFYDKNRIEVEQKWTLSTIEFENAIDLLFFREIPTGEFNDLIDWRFNLKSDQYRLFTNKVLAESRVYYFRTDQNKQIRIKIENLLNLLEGTL